MLETLGLLPLGLLVGELENGLWEGELENGLWFGNGVVFCTANGDASDVNWIAGGLGVGEEYEDEDYKGMFLCLQKHFIGIWNGILFILLRLIYSERATKFELPYFLI